MTLSGLVIFSVTSLCKTQSFICKIRSGYIMDDYYDMILKGICHFCLATLGNVLPGSI